jgi:hypothetical protein
MQHLLTEEELSALQSRPTGEVMDLLDKAREALLGIVITNTGCIHSQTNRLMYCDECPIGRAALEHSPDRNRDNYRLWSAACGQPKEYSK